VARKGEIQVALTTRSQPMYFSAKFRRLSTSDPQARPRQQRRFVRALPAARGGADSSRRMTMNRFCTIDRISRCRSFVALENRRGLCPGREKIFAVGDPQYVHLCGKRLWQAWRRI